MKLAETRARRTKSVPFGEIIQSILDHGGDTANDLELWSAFKQRALQQDGDLDQRRALSVPTPGEATAVPSDLKSRHDRLSLSVVPQLASKLSPCVL
jgi:hypothetical protein